MKQTLVNALFGAVLLLVASTASAQGYGILVIGGENPALPQQPFDDIVEESAYLVEDFGNFVVTRAYELDRALPRTVRETTMRCDADVNCYVTALSNGPFDYVLVVSAFADPQGVRVDYGMIDVRVGVLAAVTSAFMPTPADFPFLVVPCHDALKVIPEWINRGPVRIAAEPPPPPPAPPVLPPPPPRYDERADRPDLGDLGRAGAGVAGGGGALVIGGLLMGFAADETRQSIQADPHSRAQLETLQRRGQTQQRTANALMIVGAAAAGTGVVLVVVDKQSDDAAFAVVPSLNGVRLRATF